MGGNRVSEKALGAIAKIPNLTRVGFLECYDTCDGGFALLVPLQGGLAEIDLNMSVATQADLDKLKADHPRAKILTTPLAEIPKRHIFDLRHDESRQTSAAGTRRSAEFRHRTVP